MTQTTYEYARRIEDHIGPCTFPLSTDKLPLMGYSWPEMIAKVPIEIRWAGHHNNPLAIVTNQLCCIDFDHHDDNNTVPFYEWLQNKKPEALSGLYIERSKNGGIHAVGFQNESMRTKGKQYLYMVRIAGQRLGVEIKIGTHYFVSYPTPGYTPVGKTLAEMIDTGKLGIVPSYWNTDANSDAKEIRQKWHHPRHSDNLGDVNDVADHSYEDFFADQWTEKYSGSTGRHAGAGMLAKQLYASGCSRNTIRSAIECYWNRCSRKPRKGEMEEAIEDACNLTGFQKTSNSWILNRWRQTQFTHKVTDTGILFQKEKEVI